MPLASTVDKNPALSVINLKKYFYRVRGSKVTAVDGVSLDVHMGEMVVILGPSGCGKTTLLRCIAGLERPSEGEIYSDGTLISSEEKHIRVAPESRGFGMMFQSYAVWPHMSVYQNVSYPLRIKRVPKAEISERVDRVLGIVGIGHLANEYPTQLSGGQQQRVALARCLVANPKVILFDEPLSNVDAKVREELRIELRAMQERIGFAGIFVTHDQEEATAIGDRVVVMEEGKIVQIGSPREVYGAPISRFVAGFLGIVNEWQGVFREDTSSGSPVHIVETEIGDIVVSSANVTSRIRPGDSVVVTVRPEAILVTLEPLHHGVNNMWQATIVNEIFRGAYVERFIDLNGVRVRTRAEIGLEFANGQKVHVSIPTDGFRVLPMAD